MSEPHRSFFSSARERRVRAFVDGRYGEGAFWSGVARKPDDEILAASIASTRDYMLQSRACRNDKGEIFRVYPALIRTPETNALASSRGGVHICGVFYGLYLISLELCLTAMGNPDVFPEIGDPSRTGDAGITGSVPPGFWSLEQVLNHGVITDRDRASLIGPQCQVRFNFAVSLTILMLRFFWFHELYHCLNGHIGALAKHDPDLCLHEIQPENPLQGLVKIQDAALPIDKLRYLRALELDADRSALWGAFQTQIQDKENIIGIQAFPRDLRVTMAVFVAYLAIYLFDQINARRADNVIATHPHPYARLHNLIRTTATHLLDPYSEGQRVFQRVLTELGAMRRQIPQIIDPQIVVAHCRNPEFQEILDDMDRDLESCRTHFSPFGFRA